VFEFRQRALGLSTLLDDAIIDFIHAMGGLSAIAISHPHFYTTMTEWSCAFGNAPIYLHDSNKNWVKWLDAPIRLWDKERISLNDEISSIRVGGHFEGSTVLHWTGTADGKGALLVGDSMHVVRDRRWVTFMRSYPNLIPLSGKIARVEDRARHLAFSRSPMIRAIRETLRSHFRCTGVKTGDPKKYLLGSAIQSRNLHESNNTQSR
jgi:hypothetical protein